MCVLFAGRHGDGEVRVETVCGEAQVLQTEPVQPVSVTAPGTVGNGQCRDFDLSCIVASRKGHFMKNDILIGFLW